MEPIRLGAGVGVSYSNTAADLSGLTLEGPAGAYKMPSEGTLNIAVCVSAACDLYIRVGGNNLKVVSLLADTFETKVLSLPEGTAFSFRFSATNTVRSITVDYVAKGSF